MTNQSSAHKLEYDIGYAAGKVDALAYNTHRITNLTIIIDGFYKA
jgi:hypothetical protein